MDYRERIVAQVRTLGCNCALRRKPVDRDEVRIVEGGICRLHYCDCPVASADYLLVFRRTGENPVPIAHPHGLTEYAGERKMPAELLAYKGWTGKQTENRYSHWIWRQYASAFWDDVRMDRVLPYKPARDAEDEKHCHPSQLDVIERAVTLWSNPGETVLTPFMGVGSEVFAAVDSGRRGIGIELKPSYYRQAVANLAMVGKGREVQAMLFEGTESAGGEEFPEFDLDEDGGNEEIEETA